MQLTTSSASTELPAAAAPDIWAARWRVALQIASQEVRDGLFSWGFYITAALGPLLSTVFIYNSLNFVASSGLQILARPFYVPVLVSASLALVYMLAWAALAIARPREQGALRVLFFAPIDAAGLIGGHVLAGVILYVLLLLLSLPLLAILAFVTNVPFPGELLLGLACSPLCAAAAVALGLLISTLARTSRGAMFILGAALIIVLAIPAGYTALLSVPPTSRFYDALLFLRGMLRILRDTVNWISPFALLGGMLDAAARLNWLDLVRTALVALAGAIAWSVLAIWGIRRNGVL